MERVEGVWELDLDHNGEAVAVSRWNRVSHKSFVEHFDTGKPLAADSIGRGSRNVTAQEG
jgi:hypothetical protein